MPTLPPPVQSPGDAPATPPRPRPHMLTLRTLRSIFLLAALPLCAGCGMTVYKPGDPVSIDLDAATAAALATSLEHPEAGDDAWMKPETWPERWPVWSGLRRGTVAAARVKPVGMIIPIKGPVRAMRSGPQTQQKIEAEQSADVQLLMNRRRVRLGDTTVRFEGEGRGSFVYLPLGPDDPPIQGKAAIYLKFLSGREVPMPPRGQSAPSSSLLSPPAGPNADADQPEPTRLVQIQRTWLAYYEPLPEAAPARQPKGVVVLMPGLFGTPDDVVVGLLQNMRARGWGVLRLLSQPSRFTEQRTFRLTPETDIDAEGARIADVLTDRAAECAYAVHAALLYLRQERPETATVPTALVGMSGGAITLPTVLARDPQMFQSAVCIAGGVDFLRIALESTYTSWIDAVKVQYDDRVESGAVEPRLVTAYQRSAPLDTVKTAKALRMLPTLMIHARGDGAVPAHLGDELWLRAGKPERWTFNVGHELLFFLLPNHFTRLGQWIEQNTPNPAAGGAGSGATVGPAAQPVPAGTTGQGGRQ